MKVRDIPLDQIIVTKNVRLEEGELGELMDSVEQHELLQPVGVIPRGEKYELVWGHRRLAAMKLRNESTIPARILEHIADSDIPLIKLQENLQRKQLCSEEIVAAADEIKRKRPELQDGQIDVMLGKHKGYLSLHRSTLRSIAYLAQKGLNRNQLAALSDDELRAMRAKLEASQNGQGTRKSTFHRGDRLPSEGFRIIVSAGPNIVVVCADAGVKQRVRRHLRQLAKELA